MRILAAQINTTVADIEGNTAKIVLWIERARIENYDLVVFPELAITGYPTEDFLLMPSFLENTNRALEEIRQATYGIAAVVGMPRYNTTGYGKPLFNSAAVLEDGRLLGFQNKMLLPTYDVFDERRYFEPGVWTGYWNIRGRKIAITICEDIWRAGGGVKDDRYTDDPCEHIRRENSRPYLIINLSASPYSVDKPLLRFETVRKVVREFHTPLLLCNQVGGNDGLIFDGGSFFMNYRGFVQARGAYFREDTLGIDCQGLKQSIEEPLPETIQTLYDALVLGIRDFFHKQRFQRAILGISGGIDSAVVACLAADALGPDNVLGLSLPSRYSSPESIADAKELSANLGIDLRVLSIESVYQSYLDLLEPHFRRHSEDVTEENLQSRARGMILMAFANKFGYLLLNTGNKSELAMGYCTLYGDMCGALAVIGDVSKSKVYELAKWLNRKGEVIPNRVIIKEPSAELRHDQKDSDTLPPYEILDKIVELYLEEYLGPYDIAARLMIDLPEVETIIRKINAAEFKRRQSPISLRTTQKSFSVGRHFPIVHGWGRVG